MKVNVVVTKSTPSSNGGFINTLLATETVKGAFGSKTIERKLFIKSEEEQPTGVLVEIELDDFNVTVVKKEIEINGNMQPITQTWLKEKSSLDRIREVAVEI